MLTEEQIIAYLANVICIARADNKITPQETAVITKIQKQLGLKKSGYNKATAIAEAEGFKPAPVGSWTDQVMNLEHMLYVSMADGFIDATEKPLIVTFAAAVKVTQEQFNNIVGDVKQQVAAEIASATCPNCKAEITGTVKFCPECGKPVNQVVEEKAVNVSYTIPPVGIAIEFAESTAGGFPLALQIQQVAPTSEQSLKAKKKWYLAGWPSKTDVKEAMKLAEKLKGLRNRKVHVDGEELPWDTVFGFVYCATLRDEAYKPVEYCFGINENRFNIWGCQQARMPWGSWVKWFNYGKFESKGVLSKKLTFHFDKDRIRHELETNLFKCRFCPYLRFDFVEAVINEFPESVTPQDNKNWEFQRDYEESPGAVKITEKSGDGGYSFTDEYYTSGVAPKTVKPALEILRKAVEACGAKSPEIMGILQYKGN